MKEEHLLDFNRPFTHFSNIRTVKKLQFLHTRQMWGILTQKTKNF